MATRDEMTLPASRPKSRKSLGSIPSAGVMDQENMTTDFTALVKGKRTPTEKVLKKSRSKSIGPGGLDALKSTTGNRRKSLATIPAPAPRSILKPTMPPLREIPAHKSTRKGSPKKATPQSPKKSSDLIDFDVAPTPGATITGADNLPNPFNVNGNPAVNETRVTLRTEEEQEAAAREREEQERKELEKEVISRRDARRKSLANRRVSFAPEATLHTWDVVVEYQDSTTSSNATNSTRRASSISEPQTPGHANSDPSEPPSTPPEQVEEETVTASPAHQRDLHQKKRRRSSGIPPMNFNNPDDEEVFSSSPLSGSSTADTEEIVEDDEDVRSDTNSNSDNDDETAMSMDGGETTDMSMASVKSASTSGSSSRLDEALREAARLAGTQGIDFDEHGEQELTEEVVASFAPFNKPAPLLNLESQEDQENIDPFSATSRASKSVIQDDQSENEDMTMDITMDMTRPMGGIIAGQDQNDDEMSMDVTHAFGGIISNDINNAISKAKSAGAGRRQSTRRKSTSEDTSAGDETVDLTMAIGGIRTSQSNDADGDEDMTMDFTTAVGGVLPQGRQNNKSRRQSSATAKKRQTRSTRESLSSDFGDEAMDMTSAVGSILNSVKESIADELDATTGMEITTALGGILQPGSSSKNKAQAKRIMELEADLGSSPFQIDIIPNSPPKNAASTHTAASETGSPSMTGLRGKGLRRSTEARKSTTPKSKLNGGSTPVKKPATPSKQLTPQPLRPTTPSKTPPSKNISIRSASPKKLFKDEIQAVASTPRSAKSKTAATPNKLFQTGTTTPNFVLTPQRRRSSGVGLDREGLGSPRVAALLDRRVSIGEQARTFTPSKLTDYVAGVRFQDPRAIGEEIDKERQQDEDRENGRSILEREVNQPGEEKDATLNLKEMIQSLTPKKKAMKPRKSLHVGAAKGILGKRPAELDEDEDDDEGGIKRLKGHHGSPVKNVKLQGPPTKSETTTGRLTRAARKSLEEATATIATPTTSTPNVVKPTTPKDQGRFKDTGAITAGPMVEKNPVEEPPIDDESFEDERIQLQDFLNMTNIHFMELTATKRRHTLAPKSDIDSREPRDVADVSLEDCIAAGAATIPMLELFQHACHELKSYISEGRKTVREIESETFEENPPLFHLVRQAEGLEREEADLNAAAEDLASCDPEVLSTARQELVSVDSEIEAKKRMIQDLQSQLEAKDREITSGNERRQICIEEIREAEKVREECRGWTSGEISSLKAKVDTIEQEHGWTITGVSGSTTSMTYLKDIELVFDAASFLSNTSQSSTKPVGESRIDLWYIGGNRELNPRPLTIEKEFFLQSIRDHARGLPQSQTKVKDLLRSVSSSWNKACSIVDEIRLLKVSCPTLISKTSDNSIAIKSTLLIAPLTTKVEITIDLTSQSGNDGIHVEMNPTATVVYGERFNEPKMGEFLLNRCGNVVEEKGKSTKTSWGAAVAELGEKLLARGRK
ncbi:putative Kinetochore protein spc7 [Glarea lozoyensis 74030]|uniref:Putative Kinetochore protein spc7 n=1 Tax=Glarea lozoyensis (strain ATCC 74030 / MF5533) TaxID=1104152 RepID=H0EI67_GLAL7|nr:putative Kinetochore protein spc7 [Glarea lozoyensis 74030]